MASITNAYLSCIRICNADKVGYSQDYRNGQVVNGVTYYDCSSLMSKVLFDGGFTTGWGRGNAFTTATMGKVLEDLGFQKLSPTVEWRAGDILVRFDSGGNNHTEMVYNAASHITMGAHSSHYPLADQVSINTSSSSPSSWTWLYRAPTDSPGGGTWITGGDSEYFIDMAANAENNAFMVWAFFTEKGWSDKAIAALLGNMSVESTLNPALHERPTSEAVGHNGRGLVQWTSASGDSQNPLYTVMQAVFGTKNNWRNGNNQCECLYAEHQQSNYAQGRPDAKNWGIERQWYNTTLYPVTFYDWAHDQTHSITYLVQVLMANYLRPGSMTASLARRVKNADYYYSKMQSWSPVRPPSYNSVPIWLLFLMARANRNHTPFTRM